MSNYNGIEPLLNTTEGMVHEVNNVAHDDDTMSFGLEVDWFSFNNIHLTATDYIYGSGNSWFGFGASSEQLKVCRRDAKMYHFYYQKGTLWNEYNFLKMRWEGYTQYNSTSDAYKLVYEVILVDTNQIFLNVIQTPTNSSYLGTSALVCGGSTISFSVGVNSGAPYIYTFTPSDVDAGTGWSVDGGIHIETPWAKKYLIGDKDGKLYTIADDELIELSEDTPSKALFLSDGFEGAPSGEVLLSLENPKVYYWEDTSYDPPSIHLSATQTPKPQVVLTENVHLSHSTIVGVENVTIDSDDNTLFAVSFDDGDTWYNYVNDTWGLLSEELSGQTRESIEAISTNAWAEKVSHGGTIKFRFVLSGDGYVDNITIHFLN